jgi:hypothetical protein
MGEQSGDFFIINIAFSFALVMIGLMFLEGIWQGKGSVVKSFFNIDNWLFSKISDKRILKAGDQLSFIVCVLMAFFTFANGLLSVFFPKVPNVSAIFLFIGILLSWPIRIFFVSLYKNKENRDVPRIWPFPKKR